MRASALCAALMFTLLAVPSRPAFAGETGAESLPGATTSHDGGFAGIDAQAFNEMVFGSKDRPLRWTRVPRLVVLMSVMQYQPGPSNSYTASDEQLTDQEASQIVEDLTTALGLMTGDVFTRFAGVSREFIDVDNTADVLRPGTIVVGRFRGVRDAMHAIGLGGRIVDATGTIGGGAILLDADYDRDSNLRRLLRTHELGHALGYNHVQSRASIMNARIGADLTDFDRQVATINFHSPSLSALKPSLVATAR